MINIWRKFYRLSFNKQIVFIESIAWLLVFRILISVLPFKWISHLIGLTQTEQSPIFSKDLLNDAYAKTIGQAVRTISRHIGFKKPCMLEALAAQQILHLRGIPAILIVGVGYDSSRALEAHAWLTSGACIITGAKGSENYTTVSKFYPKRYTRSPA